MLGLRNKHSILKIHCPQRIYSLCNGGNIRLNDQSVSFGFPYFYQIPGEMGTNMTLFC